MSIYIGARSQDVRALALAIGLGSSLGLALGGACLLTGPERPSAPPAAEAPQLVAGAVPPSVSPVEQRARAPIVLAEALRDRFRLPTLAIAKPFTDAGVAATSTDLHCLAETVYFEARGEPQDGQRAVAQVVLNRVRHPAFPKTICAVVHQRTVAGCQFAFACASRSPAIGSLAWRRAEEVASAALHGAVMATVGDATQFRTARAGSLAGLLKVAQIGAHIFYRFGGGRGAPGMFHQAPQPSVETPRIEVALLQASGPGAVTGGAQATDAKFSSARSAPIATSIPATLAKPIVATKPGVAPLDTTAHPAPKPASAADVAASPKSAPATPNEAAVLATARAS